MQNMYLNTVQVHFLTIFVNYVPKAGTSIAHSTGFFTGSIHRTSASMDSDCPTNSGGSSW